jgi:hypothetical protein
MTFHVAPSEVLNGHARFGPDVLGRDIEAAQLITRPPQLGLGQQPQVGLGPFVAHPPSLHRSGSQ